jgi:hypothetical protein
MTRAGRYPQELRERAVLVSFTIWAASGAALARFVDDDRRQRAVSLLLAATIVASVVLLWV